MRDPAGTTAVVLAAGRGSRLSTVNPGRPKCLAPVNDSSILARLLSALEQSGTGAAVFVVGYENAAVEEAVLQSQPALPIQFVLNSAYALSGTCRSLLLGLSAVFPVSDIAVIEGDVIFDPDILAAAISSSGAATTALARWGPEHSGSCAVVEDGIITRWLHETRRPAGFSPAEHCKTVNITWLSSSAWRDGLVPALQQALREDGEMAPIEYAFDRFVQTGAHPTHALPADKWKWWEVDTPDDLHIAANLFA